MNTWKLSIKPDSESGFNAFELCQKKSLLGVGWSAAYGDTQPTTLEEAKDLVIQKFDKWPNAVSKLLEEVVSGDHIWLHQQGEYYLCRAKDEILIGAEIDPEFSNYDLGHARRADWLKIPEIFVSGVIQRGTIAQRMIQRIKVGAEEQELHKIIFDKLSVNINWRPDIDEAILANKINALEIHELFSIMTPDEVEEMVSMFLQTEGWFLVKSTCFRSKPIFEFSMVNKNAETCSVQVKSGRNPDRLSPLNYQHFLSDRTKVVLFSTNPNAYDGESVDGITCLSHSMMFDWQIKNIWSMTESLKLKLWIYLCEQHELKS